MRPAALLPYPDHAGRRPVVLHPALSDGLPLSGYRYWICMLFTPGRYIGKKLEILYMIQRNYINFE